MKSLLKKLPPNLRKIIFTVGLVIFGILALDTFTPDEITDISQKLKQEQEQEQETETFEDREHLVNRVIDGDTIVIEKDIEIRLIGVDAPEHDECWYSQSKDALTELIGGKSVRIEKDISGKDDFGRLLRYVFLPNENPFEDDIFINDWLLDNGYAYTLPITQNRRYRGLLEYSRNQAITTRQGIWGACEQEKKTKIFQPLEANEPPPGPDYIIKGNVSTYGKNYFIPGCPNYKRIKIDSSRGDQYFRTEQEAQAAGFTKSASCK